MAPRRGAIRSEPTGLGTCAGSPKRKRTERQEEKQDNPCFFEKSPDTVIHASIPTANVFFPAHRLPPFNEFALISSFNEPYNEEKTRDRTPYWPGHRIPYLQEWISIR
jgi:hypothetical protein